jgi:hypothetical protein
MNIFVKAVIALCIGLGAMAGLQVFYLHSVIGVIRSDAARSSASLTSTKPAFSFDAVKLGAPIIPKMAPIDTSAGQRAAIMSKAHQIDLQIRAAQSAVPIPRTYPGMRRF